MVDSLSMEEPVLRFHFELVICLSLTDLGDLVSHSGYKNHCGIQFSEEMLSVTLSGHWSALWDRVCLNHRLHSPTCGDLSTQIPTYTSWPTNSCSMRGCLKVDTACAPQQCCWLLWKCWTGFWQSTYIYWFRIPERCNQNVEYLSTSQVTVLGLSNVW